MAFKVKSLMLILKRQFLKTAFFVFLMIHHKNKNLELPFFFFNFFCEKNSLLNIWEMLESKSNTFIFEETFFFFEKMQIGSTF
jgi:hypothetical protein